MSQKILVVDDEPDLQMLMLQKFRRQVRSREFEFLFAENGEHALEMLEEEPSLSLVLSDINMPRMDGLTLLQEMDSLNRVDLKAVIVSAYGDMDNIRTAMNRGAYDFVTKPIDFQDLETTIAKTLKEISRIKAAQKMEEQLKLLQHDLDLAATIQQKMLPQVYPPFPDEKRFQLFGKMIAAKHVGGDFFDFFRIDDDRLAFFIGDVAGKGMPAALFMAQSRTTLKSIGSEVPDPAECLAKANTMLIPESDDTTFVTVFYGVLNARTGELTYSNGGHNPPYIHSENGDVRPLEDVGGLLLGMFEGAEYETGSVTLQPGDSILMYTDGVTEAMNENEEVYDEMRLEEYLKQVNSNPIDNRVKRLFVEVMKFTGSAPQSDDITVLAVKYRGENHN